MVLLCACRAAAVQADHSLYTKIPALLAVLFLRSFFVFALAEREDEEQKG